MPKSKRKGVAAESRPTILVRLPAIIEADLARLEKRLKLKLPSAYRRFLLNYPSVLIETKTDMGWCHESLSDRKLRFNIDELIYYNESVRAPGTPWTPINRELFSAGAAQDEVKVSDLPEGSELAGHSLPWLLVLVFLGGLALNLTPCVFPLPLRGVRLHKLSDQPHLLQSR